MSRDYTRLICLARVYRSNANGISTEWTWPKSTEVRPGDTIGFAIVLEDPIDWGGFSVEYDITVIPGITKYQGTLSVGKGDSRWCYLFGITMDHQVVQPLIILKYEVGMWTSTSHLEIYEIEKSRIFTFYVEQIGSFAVDYLPITILYGPPFKDMRNMLRQNASYGTVTEFGESRGIISLDSSVRGPGGTLISTSDRTGNPGSTNRSDFAGNTVTFGYDWISLLSADNRNVIDESNWGPWVTSS